MKEAISSKTMRLSMDVLYLQYNLEPYPDILARRTTFQHGEFEPTS